MTQNVPKNKGYLVYFDSLLVCIITIVFHTSTLYGIGVLGTIQQERFPGLGPSDADMKKMGEDQWLNLKSTLMGLMPVL